MKPSLNNLARIAGILAGAGIVLLVLLAAKPTRDAESGLPASASFTVPAPGELEITPAAPQAFLTARELVPGGERASETFEVRNQSGRRYLVGFAADAEVRALDGLLRVRLVSGRTVLADSTLQGLRSNSLGQLPIEVGQAREVELEAWLPASVVDGYQGHRVDVSLVPNLEPVR